MFYESKAFFGRPFLPLTFLIFFGFNAHANQVIRPRTIQELGFTYQQKAYRVKKARLAWVNYFALRKDFPELKKLSNPKIDQWIIENFAYISEQQLLLQEIRNSKIDHDRNDVNLFLHPPEYGRSSVIEARYNNMLIGLVDLKSSGTGAENRRCRRTDQALQKTQRFVGCRSKRY